MSFLTSTRGAVASAAASATAAATRSRVTSASASSTRRAHRFAASAVAASASSSSSSSSASASLARSAAPSAAVASLLLRQRRGVAVPASSLLTLDDDVAAMLPPPPPVVATGLSGEAADQRLTRDQAERLRGQRVPFLETALDPKELPFRIPEESWLRTSVGNTPLHEIEKNLFAKLEGENYSGSIKDRMVLVIVLRMFRDGILKDGSTLCLTTSGSAGKSLALLQRTLKEEVDCNLNCVIAMPLAYQHKLAPQELIKAGIPVHHNEPGPLDGSQLLFVDKVFMEVLADMKDLSSERGWVVLDQHHDPYGMMAHRSTALELMVQQPDLTDVVCATGTGATAAGLRAFLPESVTVHSRPSESGAIDGLSDVNRYNNFCNTDLLQGYDAGVFDREVATRFKDTLAAEFDVDAGLSSGATHWLAREIKHKADRTRAATADLRDPACSSSKVAFISADGSATPRRDTLAAAAAAAAAATAGASGAAGAARAAPATVAVAAAHPPPRSRGLHTRSSAAPVVAAAPQIRDRVIVGGGPVGSATAMFLAEHEAETGGDKTVTLIHDPTNRGAHEDWSRLARLSFDGPRDEFDLSKHACDLLDLVDEVRANMSGAPCLPVKPGMLFVASPGSAMAKTCANGMTYGDTEFVQRSPDELADLYPGNEFNLPRGTLCWTHPTGYCVSPIELTDTMLGVARSYGVEIVHGRAALSRGDDGRIRVTVPSADGAVFETNNAYLFAGAEGKQILAESEGLPAVPEMDQTYITAISTVRYRHRNHPANPKPGSGHVVQPIILGQLDVPDIADYQTNFSVVPEEYGDVLKTRLSGAAGQEVIETVAGLHDEKLLAQDPIIAEIYGNLFGTLFPHLETEKALDFNRCVTYRNHYPQFSGTSLLEVKPTETSSLLVTPGCFGVGVKFGPALGQAAAAHTNGTEVEEGMNIFQSGTLEFKTDEDIVERAW